MAGMVAQKRDEVVTPDTADMQRSGSVANHISVVLKQQIHANYPEASRFEGSTPGINTRHAEQLDDISPVRVELQEVAARHLVPSTRVAPL
jgi:hypothetical protein